MNGKERRRRSGGRRRAGESKDENVESGLLFAQFTSGSTIYTPTVNKNSSAHSKVIQVRLDQLQHAPESMAERLRTHPPTHPRMHARTTRTHAHLNISPCHLHTSPCAHTHTHNMHTCNVQISPVYIHLSLLNMLRGSSTWSRICVHMSWGAYTHAQKKQHTHTHVFILPFYILMSSLNIL